jgi:NADH-quinone oxidoreductase subunit I
MRETWKELWTKKVTMQYPENRKTLVISDRWRSELIMPHDENNEHACTACQICMMNCPNGTITVTPKMIVTEDGKKKKILDTHVWNYGSCTFCNLCVITCPSNAIIFNNDFEGAVFNKSKLIHQLNHEGSKLREKKKEPVAVKQTTSSTESNSTTHTVDENKTIKTNETKTQTTSVGKSDSINVEPSVEQPNQTDNNNDKTKE